VALVMSIGVWALCIIAATIIAYELTSALVTGEVLRGLFGFQKAERPIFYWALIASLGLIGALLGFLILFTNVDSRLTIR